MDKFTPLAVEVDGRTWHLWPVDFKSPDGTYSVYLYAISREHALLQLEALKETGRLGEQIVGVYC
jgi:hypothetical protein